MAMKYKYSIEVNGKKKRTNSESKVADYLLDIKPSLRKKLNKRK